jgi:hypothetical protein
VCQKFALPKSDLRSHSDLCLKRAASSIIDLKPGEVSEILALYQLNLCSTCNCQIFVYFYKFKEKIVAERYWYNKAPKYNMELYRVFIWLIHAEVTE